jgi:hypothetical protein
MIALKMNLSNEDFDRLSAKAREEGFNSLELFVRFHFVKSMIEAGVLFQGEQRCPRCGGTDVNFNPLHNYTPLEEQVLYTCQDCFEQFGRIE